MTMDVSRLGIVVESTGIKEARNALDGGNGRGGLFGAAEKTEKAVTKLTDSFRRLLTTNATGTATAWNQSLGQLSGTMVALNATILATTRALERLGPAMQNAGDVTERASRANARKSATGNVVTNTLKAMTTAALAYVSVNFAASIVKQADSWIMMEAKLRNATGSLNNARVAQQQMFELSQRLRVPLEDSVKLYTRLAPAVQRLGKDSNYAREMVEGISTALQLSGANGAEASSVMLQLSQSFSSGVLNGAEFNAVAENGSVLMRALEKYTGKTTYELKKMGSEGKLSMDVVGKAIQAALPEWRKQFDMLPMTFEGAMQRLSNAWTKAVGDLGQSTGFNTQLSQALLSVEKLIPAIAGGLGNAFIAVMGWIEKNKKGLQEVLETSWQLVKSVWEISAAFASVTGSIAEAAGGTTAFGFALKLAAYFAAAIADGFTTIATAITHVGLLIARVITAPLRFVALLIGGMIGGLASLLETASEGLAYLGKAKAAEEMASFAKSARDASDAVFATSDKVGEMLDNGHALANSWMKDIANGEGAIGKLDKAAEKTAKKISTIADLRKLEAGEMNATDWNAAKGVGPKIDPKAAAAEATAIKRHTDAMEHLNAKLREQIELKAGLAERGLDYDKINPAQKEVIKLQEHFNRLVNEGASQARLWETIQQMALAKKAAALSTENERTLERLRLEDDVVKKQQSSVSTLKDEADQLERKVATYGMAKGAIEAMELAASKARLADLESTSDGQRNAAMEARIALLREEIDLRERIASAGGALGQLDSMKEFDKLFDARKAERFGNVLAEGFGKAGKAMGQLANAADKYLARQAKISQGRTILDKMDKKSADYAKASMKLAEEEAESRIASYADMAGAAKTFFEEGSKGYKAMEAAEKTFRAFQMAMQVKAFLQESGFLSTITSLFVASKATEVAATAKTVAPTIAANSAKQGSNAVTALTSALAIPFPANIAAFAVVAAMLAAIGVGVAGAGGGKGVDVAKMRQEQQGTGTVFGDESAKSESISKSLELLSKNSDIALRYSSGMLSSLQNIEYSLTGATSGVIRTGGSVTGKDFAGGLKLPSMGQSLMIGGPMAMAINQLGRVLGGKLGSLLTSSVGFSSKSELMDSGLMGNKQSIANILQNGFNVSGFQDVKTSKSAFGIKYSTKTSTNTVPIDAAISQEFGNVVKGMVDSLVGAAGALGMSGDAVRAKLEAMSIDIGKISLKDLSSEEIQKQLEAVFSAIGDKLSTAALPEMVRFQKAGEGLLETAVRVASGVEQANYALEKLGIAAVTFQELTTTTGDVGAEIVRQSILRQESSAGIKEIIKTLTDDAGGIAATYKSLSQVRDSLIALHIASDVSRDLIRAAGGLDALQDALDEYQENYFSESEKVQMKTSALAKEFAKLGLSMPGTKEGFRALVEQLSASGTSGQELAAKVILLAGSFAELQEAQASLTDSIGQARDDLAEAYDREAGALKETRDRFTELAKSLGEFKTSLLTGDLSTLNVAGKYDVEKKKFEETLAKAKSGDVVAMEAFESVASSFLQASRAMNASSSVYTADFERVLAATDLLQGMAQGKTSVAEQQLALLDAQVKGLLEVNESVLTVAQAIANLTALLGGGTVGNGSNGPTVTIPVAPPPGAQTAESPAQAALIAQVAALTAEVQGLRQDQMVQTGDIIASNYETSLTGAEVITDGIERTASIQMYRERAQTKLA